MFVAVGRVVLRIVGARSLKDRRQVVRSYKDRVRARLGVSVAEVGDVENHQLASLGVAVVAREGASAEAALSSAFAIAEQLAGALVVDTRREVLPFHALGGLWEGGGDVPASDLPFGSAGAYDDETKRNDRDGEPRPRAEGDDPTFERWKRS